MYRVIRRVVKKAFRAAGFDIRRCETSNDDLDPPPLFDDPLDALLHHQGGKPAAFACPLNQTRSRLGFCYGSDGWHPYVETLKEYESGRCTSYEGSILQAYHQCHQPESAAEALVGFGQPPPAFARLPGHLFFLSPWTSDSVDEVDQNVRKWVRERNVYHDRPQWDLDSDGYLLHGPVSLRKGRVEYECLIELYETIKREGYDRSHGDVRFQILRRGNAFRFLQWGGGSHRTAVMAALGHTTVPGVFRRPRRIIDVEMVDHWPQVRRGVWGREHARAYVDHLFDFDARAWARDEGLVSEKTTAAGCR
jgi:hypothetical protein